MYSDYDKLFVRQFVVKNKRERLTYELSKKEKRLEAIERFCHNTKNYIIESKIIYEGNFIQKSELINFIQKYCTEAKCGLIAWNSEIDGKVLPYREALDIIIGNGMPAILVFYGFAVIETEQEQGPAVKYVLRETADIKGYE